ncbi:MAG: hypothetical protein WC781_00765 [Candidatus Pacearchaeota archaeon]|jgi:hypothetical protein
MRRHYKPNVIRKEFGVIRKKTLIPEQAAYIRKLEETIAEAYIDEDIDNKTIDKLYAEKARWENPNVTKLELILGGIGEYWTLDKRLKALENYVANSDGIADRKRHKEINFLFESLKNSKSLEKKRAKNSKYINSLFENVENYISNIKEKPNRVYNKKQVVYPYRKNSRTYEDSLNYTMLDKIENVLNKPSQPIYSAAYYVLDRLDKFEEVFNRPLEPFYSAINYTYNAVSNIMEKIETIKPVSAFNTVKNSIKSFFTRKPNKLIDSIPATANFID